MEVGRGVGQGVLVVRDNGGLVPVLVDTAAGEVAGALGVVAEHTHS